MHTWFGPFIHVYKYIEEVYTLSKSRMGKFTRHQYTTILMCIREEDETVRICPQINHMKLHEHIRRLLLSPRVCIARSKLFLLFLFFPFNSRCYNLPPWLPFYIGATVQGLTKPTNFELLDLHGPTQTRTPIPTSARADSMHTDSN
jgi:hypothetical protein